MPHDGSSASINEVDEVLPAERTARVTDEITLLSTYRARESEAPVAEQVSPIATDESGSDDAALTAVSAQGGAFDGIDAGMQTASGEGDPAKAGAGATLLVFTRTLVRPARALRSVSPTSWQIGVGVVAAAALVRTAAFAATGILADGASGASVLPGAAASLASPLVCVAVGTLALLAVSAITRSRLKTSVAVSLASFATAPIALQALLQTVVMAATRHAIHPTGIIGLVAPDAPVLPLFAFAPVDLFAVWAIALVIVAAVVSTRGSKSVAQPTGAEASPTSVLNLEQLES